MLGKLIKYEFRATGRTFLPIYAAILAVSLILNISIRFTQLETMSLIAALTLFALMVAMGVISLMTIIQRFKNNLLGDEGYLMFTLPVSTEKLIVSKLITAAVWLVVSAVVAVLSGLVIIANGEMVIALKELMAYLPKIMGAIKGEYIYTTLQAVVCLLLQTIIFILMIYTSLSVSQMAIFNKHRGIISFAAFIIINIVLNSIVGVLFNRVFGDSGYFDTLPGLQLLLNISIAINAIVCGGLFVATDYLLKKHLNIE